MNENCWRVWCSNTFRDAEWRRESAHGARTLSVWPIEGRIHLGRCQATHHPPTIFSHPHARLTDVDGSLSVSPSHRSVHLETTGNGRRRHSASGCVRLRAIAISRHFPPAEERPDGAQDGHNFSPTGRERKTFQNFPTKFLHVSTRWFRFRYK